MLTGMNLFSFIVTSPTGRVLDFGTYYSAACAEDTAHDSPVTEPGTILTIVRHDDDGSHEVITTYPLLTKQEG